MEFITDKQTLADLNLLGKYKTGSLFNFFNRVKTKGGELLLEEMFRAPLTDVASINMRSASIRYLQKTGVGFEIDNDHLEDALEYLIGKRPSGFIGSLLICYQLKIQEILYHSDNFQVHQKQTKAMLEIFRSADILLGNLEKLEEKDNPCKSLQRRLSEALQNVAIQHFEVDRPFTLQETAHLQDLFLNKFRSQVERLFHILYEFDVLISVASVAAERKLSYAAASIEDSDILIEAENLKHPTLSDAIGNSILLSREKNLLFLTGANMAGKSTWMKTLGVSFYLAHMGFPIAADLMSFQVMEGIFTSINVPDDIDAGWSHFYAEVMRVKSVAKEVSDGKRVFVLFDELFKGTNVKDAYDATLAVTERLADYKGCAFVISTHIIEVGEALLKRPSVIFRYMPTIMVKSKPQYTYHLTEGITTDRQGMIIIENEKILEILG
ncbi:DNA mismatch repair ATPase MutS [Pedobacter cryoconitis]|uniref:MutS-related protein n=1 Tax=Pedobacter cryoconitis TaxID=188932 RepID=UPI00161A5F6B|nr:DNA mismatch repair protein [Pedobacter cryoconitis]MBB6271877.1 DNA mismatch repair ATPase MutS [Pedobacter cryoconitis]